MSIDFLPGNNFFVTCGPDDEDHLYVRFWRWEEVKKEVSTNIFKVKRDDTAKKNDYFLGNEENKPEFLYGDSGHTVPPNVVRFSSRGTYLASGGCDSIIMIWDYRERYSGIGSSEKIFKWGQSKSLRGHVGDITDLCWSNDEKYLVSGSIDNFALLWNVEKH